MLPLLDSGNVDQMTTVEEFSRTDQSIAGRYHTELVDIFVNKGNVNRNYTERLMAQKIDFIIRNCRKEFANVAKHFACDYFSIPISSSSESKAESVQFAEVMQALQDWEHAESTEASQ